MTIPLKQNSNYFNFLFKDTPIVPWFTWNKSWNLHSGSLCLLRLLSDLISSIQPSLLTPVQLHWSPCLPVSAWPQNLFSGSSLCLKWPSHFCSKDIFSVRSALTLLFKVNNFFLHSLFLLPFLAPKHLKTPNIQCDTYDILFLILHHLEGNIPKKGWLVNFFYIISI